MSVSKPAKFDDGWLLTFILVSSFLCRCFHHCCIPSLELKLFTPFPYAAPYFADCPSQPCPWILLKQYYIMPSQSTTTNSFDVLLQRGILLKYKPAFGIKWQNRIQHNRSEK